MHQEAHYRECLPRGRGRERRECTTSSRRDVRSPDPRRGAEGGGTKMSASKKKFENATTPGSLPDGKPLLWFPRLSIIKSAESPEY